MVIVCIMSQHIYLYSTSFLHKHLWHSLVYVCTLAHVTPITIDLFLQAIIIPNALVTVFIVIIIYSLFLWGTPAPIVEVIN